MSKYRNTDPNVVQGVDTIDGSLSGEELYAWRPWYEKSVRSCIQDVLDVDVKPKPGDRFSLMNIINNENNLSCFSSSLYKHFKKTKISTSCDGFVCTC